MKKFLTSTIAFILALSTAACMNTENVTDGTGTDNTNTEAASGSTSSNETFETTAGTAKDSESEGTDIPDDITLSAPDAALLEYDGVKLNVFALRYFFANAYTDFYQTNYSEITQYFDPTLPLHNQKPTQSKYSEYETWYDYFLSLAKRDLEYYLVFAAQAKKSGLTLTSEEISEVDENVNKIIENAKGYNISFAEYMEEFEMMGPDLTPEIVKETYYIFQLATKYSQKLYDEFNVTVDEVDAYFEEHKDHYSLVDYNLLMITPDFDATSSDSEVKAAKEKADKEATDFINYVKSGKTFPEAYRLVYPKLSAKEYEEFEKTYLTKKAECYYQNYKGEYVKSNVTEWLFADGRQNGEITKLVDSQGRIKVVQAVKVPYKMVDPIPTIRYIYIDLSLQKYTESTAKKLAEELIDRVGKATDKDAEFVKLVTEYSDDTITKDKGGLAKDILPSSLAFPSNVVSWCFEDGRKLYDCGYQEYTSYGVICGYFITFISSYGEPYYQYMIDSSLRSEKLANYVKDILKTSSIEYAEEHMDSIFE